MKVEDYADLLGWTLRASWYMPEGLKILFERNMAQREALFILSEERVVIYDVTPNGRVYRNWASFSFSLQGAGTVLPIEDAERLFVGFKKGEDLHWLHLKHVKNAPPALLKVLREEHGWDVVLRSLSRTAGSPSCDSV
jgi:hypothetical protein